MKKTKLFLLGGQSNMVGSGEIKDLASPYTEALPAIRIWNAGKGWIPLVPGHDGRSEFGPEIAFGHEMAALLPEDDVRLVKYDPPIIDPETNQGHYNAEGNLLNGRRFAEAMKPFLR